MKILGIETSCDETAAAVIEDGTKIISNVVASSAEMHAKTGGVIPEQAARQQVKSIIPVVNEALNGIDKNDIDAIAVTVGPGLIGSLLVGVETAKTLAHIWNKPIIPVNHLVAHLYANWLASPEQGGSPEFPALGLVVSGGHTDLVLIKSHGRMKYVGGTRDDAAGEAFDKTARLLGLPYPGGPNLSKEAQKFLDKNKKPLTFFPRPLSDEDGIEWSFSGLKTSALRSVQGTKNIEQKIPELSAEIQEAIVDSLVSKSIKAIQQFRPKSFLLAGGVAANRRLREKFTHELSSKGLKTQFHVPEPKLCTDNAAYIAACAFYQHSWPSFAYNYKTVDWKKVEANPELTITSRF